MISPIVVEETSLVQTYNDLQPLLAKLKVTVLQEIQR